MSRTVDKTKLTKEQRLAFLSYLARVVTRASGDRALRGLMRGQAWPPVLALLEEAFLFGVLYIMAHCPGCLMFNPECGFCVATLRITSNRMKGKSAPRKPAMSRPKRRK